MKEVRYFYVPKAGELDELPQEEAQHAIRVLRLVEGDEIFLMDGEGVSSGQRSLLPRGSIVTIASLRAFLKRKDGKDICISLWLLRR